MHPYPHPSTRLREGGVPTGIGIEGADAHEPVHASLALAPPVGQGAADLCMYIVRFMGREMGGRIHLVEGLDKINRMMSDVGGDATHSSLWTHR